MSNRVQQRGPIGGGCSTDNDCIGRCPPAAKTCVCGHTPKGQNCVPGCDVDTDCPIDKYGKQMVCLPKKQCGNGK